MNFNLSVRHYWALAENNQINTLNTDGSLTPNDTYTTNKNSNFSTWNLDLSYSWWFAPGSQMSVLYRNNAATFDRTINKNFNSNTFPEDKIVQELTAIDYYLQYKVKPKEFILCTYASKWK